MIVRVKGVGVKLAGKWCFKNQTVEISKEEYEANKEYVEIIEEDIAEPKNSEGEQETLNNNANDTNVDSIDGENPKGNDGEDEELNALKARAKELGINVTHNMRKDTIIKKIEEATEDIAEPKNSEGE